MYPFSYVGIVTIGCHPYFWNLYPSSLSKRVSWHDNWIVHHPVLYHIIQKVSFIISDWSEESIPHNSYNPQWLAKGVVVGHLNK
jgi:hypothetical protein